MKLRFFKVIYQVLRKNSIYIFGAPTALPLHRHSRPYLCSTYSLSCPQPFFLLFHTFQSRSVIFTPLLSKKNKIFCQFFEFSWKFPDFPEFSFLWKNFPIFWFSFFNFQIICRFFKEIFRIIRKKSIYIFGVKFSEFFKSFPDFPEFSKKISRIPESNPELSALNNPLTLCESM